MESNSLNHPPSSLPRGRWKVLLVILGILGFFLWQLTSLIDSLCDLSEKPMLPYPVPPIPNVHPIQVTVVPENLPSLLDLTPISREQDRQETNESLPAEQEAIGQAVENPEETKEDDKTTLDTTLPNDHPWKNGLLPPLKLDYQTHLGFFRYVEEMHKRNAIFFIPYIDREKTILQLDFPSKSFIIQSLDTLKKMNLSPRIRVLKDEPGLIPFLEKAKTLYHLSNPQIILLIPLAMEQQIADGLWQYVLRPRHISPEKVTSVEGKYCWYRGKLAIQFLRIYTAEQTYWVDFTLFLS